MPTGGDITEITFNNPLVGSGTIFPKAGEDSAYDLGGFRASDDANMIDGGGNMIVQLNRVRWSFKVVVAWDMNDQETLEKVNQLIASTAPTEWTFTNVNGTVYGGTGVPVGDYEGNGNQSTFTLKVAGGKVLKKN
ncbi:MAG: hypothetical protein U0T32_12020 [Chitinophagales bacterium]